MQLAFWKRKKQPIDVGRTPEAARYLAGAIEHLMSLPLVTKDDLHRWHSERDRVQAELKQQFPGFGFYREVWHFFADPDIRARDSGYLAYQHRLMSDYVSMLRENRTILI
jgi:hypothetical protein